MNSTSRVVVSLTALIALAGCGFEASRMAPSRSARMVVIAVAKVARRELALKNLMVSHFWSFMVPLIWFFPSLMAAPAGSCSHHCQ